MSEEKKGFFGRLAAGLAKTRNSISNGLNSIFSAFSSIDDEFYDELEEEAMALEEQLAHLRGYRDILEMYTDYRGMRGCEDLPFV